MGINVEWGNAERTLLIYTFSAHWEWDEYYEATDRGRDMIASVGHYVDVIFDFDQTRVVPQGALKHFGNSFKGFADAPPNVSRMVVVGATGLLVIIGNVLRNLYPRAASNVFEALTIEQAYNILSAGV